MFVECSPECLATFLGILGDIPWNVLQHSLECLVTFSGMFGDIPWNTWWYSPLECFKTFPEIFGDIPQNVWRHSPEYNIPPIPSVSCIPFPVPAFLFLYIAIVKLPLTFSGCYNTNVSFSIIWIRNSSHRSWKYLTMIHYGKTKKFSNEYQRFDWIKLINWCQFANIGWLADIDLFDSMIWLA